MKLGKPDYGAVNLDGWSLPGLEQDVDAMLDPIAEALREKVIDLILPAAAEALQRAAEEDLNAFFTTENGVKLAICLKLDNGGMEVGPSWLVDLKETLGFQLDHLSPGERETFSAYFSELAKWIDAK